MVRGRREKVKIALTKVCAFEGHLLEEFIEWRVGLNCILCICKVPELLEHKDISVYEPTRGQSDNTTHKNKG